MRSPCPLWTAEEAAELIPDGATIGFSGFTAAGAAKAVPRALAARARREHAAGRPFRVGVLTGASTRASLDGALAELAPEARAGWAEWVAGQLGNIYEVRTVSVRAPSALARPIEATAVMEVNRDYPDERYSASARVPVEQVDGRWYLTRPLLAPS